MKIRQGHVSNSSSSSFIVIFDRDPRDKKWLKQAFFGGQEQVPEDYGDDMLSVDSLVHYLSSSFRGKLTMKDMVSVLTGGWNTIPGFDVERPSGIESYRNGEMEKYNELEKIAAKEYLLKWIGDADIEHIYISELADDDGSIGSKLEHGDTFRNFKHIRISNH